MRHSPERVLKVLLSLPEREELLLKSVQINRLERNSQTHKAAKRWRGGKSASTDSHTSTVVEDMADIKQQLKELTGSLALITPVVTEIKSAYDNYNDEGNGSESELEQTDDASGTLGEPPKKKTKGGIYNLCHIVGTRTPI